jgi:hypothetical protein
VDASVEDWVVVVASLELATIRAVAALALVVLAALALALASVVLAASSEDTSFDVALNVLVGSALVSAATLGKSSDVSSCVEGSVTSSTAVS